MFVHGMRQARPPRRGGAVLHPRRLFVIVAAALLMQGCKTTSSLVAAAADPSDPDAPVRAIVHRSTTGTYVRQRPLEPRPWREQNESVTPRPRP